MGSQQKDPYPVLVYVTSQQEDILRQVFNDHGWDLILYGCKVSRKLANPRAGKSTSEDRLKTRRQEVSNEASGKDSDEDLPSRSSKKPQVKSPVRKSKRLSGKLKNYAENDWSTEKADVIAEVNERIEEFMLLDEDEKFDGKRQEKGIDGKRQDKGKQMGTRNKVEKKHTYESLKYESRRARKVGRDASYKVSSEIDDEETDECPESEQTCSDEESDTDSNTEEIGEIENMKTKTKSSDVQKVTKKKPSLQDTEKLTNHVLNRIGDIKTLLSSLPGEECPQQLASIFSQLIKMTEILSVALAQIDPAILSEYSGEVIHYVDPKAYKIISPVVQTVMENLMDIDLNLSHSNSCSADDNEMTTSNRLNEKSKEKTFVSNPRNDLYMHVCRLKHVLECLPCEDIPTQFYDMLFQYLEMADMVIKSIKHMKERLQESLEQDDDQFDDDWEDNGHYNSEESAALKGLSQDTLEKVRQKSTHNIVHSQLQQDVVTEETELMDNLFPDNGSPQLSNDIGNDMFESSAAPPVKKPKVYKRRPRQPCPHCNKTFSRRTLCFRHIESCHPEHAMSYVCYTCQATFRTYSQLNRHKKVAGHAITEPPGPVICELCGKTLSKKAAYDVHMNSVHKELYDVKCDICGKLFKSEITMRDHKNFVHTRDQAICDFCGKSFDNRKKMMCHRSRHVKERAHRCGDCGKGFFTKTLLAVHRMIHTGEKPHKCPHCPYATAFKNNLPKHIKIHKVH